MSKELEYFQEIIKVDEEALTLANKEKNKKRDVMLHRHWFNQRKNSIEKALKALDIIKNKIVLIDVIVDSENVNDYNDFVSKSKDRHLTQEEYDLLREVLKVSKWNAIY